MKEFFKRRPKEVAPYIPKLDEIQKEINDLVLGPEFDSAITDRLVSLSRPDLGPIKISKSDELKSITISVEIAEEVFKPILVISPGSKGDALIATNKTSKNLTFWKLPYTEILEPKDLRNAVRKIILGEPEPKVYPMGKAARAA
jgi:hypothetical protein